MEYVRKSVVQGLVYREGARREHHYQVGVVAVLMKWGRLFMYLCYGTDHLFIRSAAL